MANLKQLMKNNRSSSFLRTETLDTLEADDNYQDRSERFLTSLGEKSDDIFEYLRDSDYNLYNGFNRAMQSKKFTSQQKSDYAYLRKRFDNADTGSLKQYLAAAKDISIDVASDPTVLTALIAAPITGGVSLASRAALGKGVSTGLKQLAKNQTNKTIAVGAVETGAWTGLDNHFRQSTEINTDIRKLYSNPELVGSTLLGVGMGGLLGAGLQKLSLVHSKNADLFSDDLYLDEIGSTALYKLSSKKDAVIARTIGKPTAILNTKAQISPLSDQLRKKIRYDSGKDFFNRTTKRLDYSFGEDVNWRMGNYKVMYEKAVAPLYTKQQGIMTIKQQQEVISILRNPNIESKDPNVNLVAKNLKAFYSTIFNHAKINKLISPERKIENYFPISWNRKTIDENTEEFKNLLVSENVVSAKNVDETVMEMLDKKSVVYSEASNLLTSARTLDIKDENVFAKFLNDDLHTISHKYYMQAARNIERKKAFGLRNKDTGELVLTNKSALQEFEDQWVRPIDLELKSKGVKGGLTRVEEKNIVNLYKTLVGDLNHYTSEATQGIYDTLKLSQQMAHLPLATVSSMSEILIPLSRSRPDKYSKELIRSIGDAGELFTKKIPRLLQSDKHNLSQPEVFNEMNKVFLAVEEALADRVESLTGEGIQNKTIQKISRGFFKANLLTQWTKTVQLASFNIGKDIITSNLKALHKASKTGTDVFKAKGNIRRYREELLELGIDIEKGIKWVDGGAKKGDTFKAYSELAENEQFYQTNLMRGAGRFVNEVILNPSREQALKPIIQSNPKADILFQFLGYPTAFSNTVLKNFARQVMLNPAVNAPRVLSTTLLMTGVATGLNYFRGSDATREDYFKDPQETIFRALKRVGLLGPLEHGERFSNSLEYSKNPALSALTLGGPIVDDIFGSLFYRRGLAEVLSKNLPFYSSGNMLENLTGVNPYNPIVEGAKQTDKDLKEAMFGTTKKNQSKYNSDYSSSYRQNYAEGGEVLNELPSLSFIEDDTLDLFSVNIDTNNPVLNVKADPSQRTNPYTGQAYKKGILGSLERKQAATGGEIRQQYMAGALVSKVGAKLFSPTLKAIRTYATKDLKGQGAIDFVTSPKAIQKGIKPREIERLEVVDYLKNNPDVSLIDALPEISKKEIKVSGETQLTPTGMTRHAAFNNPKDASVSSLDLSKVLRSELMKGDKDIVPLEESIAMIREPNRQALSMQDVTQEEIFNLFPSGNNKKINFIDDPFGEAFIYGNETDGYSAFYKENFFTMNFPKDLNEAKIRFKHIINGGGEGETLEIVSKEEYKKVGSNPIQTYGKVKAFKTFIDKNLPGGKNYEEISINWDNAIQKHTVGHFNPDSKNQIMHILGRDRKLEDGTLSKHADEVQSDLETKGREVGYQPPPKEVEKEKDKVSKLLDGISSKNYTGKPDQVKYELFKHDPHTRRSRPFFRVGILTESDMPSSTVSRRPEDFPLITPPEEEDIYRGLILTLDDIVKLSDSVKERLKMFKYDKLVSADKLPVRAYLPSWVRKNKKTYSESSQKYPSVYGTRDDNTWQRGIAKDNLVEALGEDIHKLSDSVKILLQDQKGVPNYPLQKDFELLGVKQWLLKAIKEDKDAISFSPSEVIVERYSESSKEKYIKIYDIQIPKAMKKLAKKYGGKFEKGELNQADTFGKEYPFSEEGITDNVEELMQSVYKLQKKGRISRPERMTLESMIESSRANLGGGEYSTKVTEPDFIKKQLLIIMAGKKLKANILRITPEMKEKILAEGLPLYGYRKGGLVKKLQQRNMYG